MLDGCTYIIAEIGINFNGSFDNCIRMIDAAVEAGCDAAKFQLFRAKYLYPKSAGQLDWRNAEKSYSYDIYSAVEKFELREDWIDNLINYCSDRGIEFLSSVSDSKGCDFLVEKRVKALKLTSYTITNIPLIDHCARTGLPLYMSTGGATLGEIEEAVATILSYHDKVTLMHCSIQYPTALKDCNLGVIETLRFAFPAAAIGYSDHTQEVFEAPVQAVYLGARAIEKHITLDKGMDGPDHFFALEPRELKEMVRRIRQAEKEKISGNYVTDQILYGSTAKKVYPHEAYLRKFAFMKLYARRDIKCGELISPADVSILRSGKKEPGLDPKFLYLFERYQITAKKNLACEDPITWETILS